MKQSRFKQIFIPTLSLFLICLIVSVALSVTNYFTKNQIAENEQKSKYASMEAVIPGATEFTELIPDSMYIGHDKDGNSIGCAISTEALGYGGQVKVMTGIDNEGKIIAIDVYYNDDETPGLGKNTSSENFTKQFSGKDASGNLEAVKAGSSSHVSDEDKIDAVTSATISSTAVTKAVNEACTIWKLTVNGGE